MFHAETRAFTSSSISENLACSKPQHALMIT
jgi:hypothetical protein